MKQQFPKTISGRQILWQSLGLLAVLGASYGLTGRCQGGMGHIVAATRAVSGLTLLFFVPGVLFVPWVWRRPDAKLSAVLGWAFAANVVLFIATISVIKCLGATVTSGTFLSAIAGVSLLAGAIFHRRFQSWTVANDFAGLVSYTAVGAVLLLAFVGLTSAPPFPSEHDYLTTRDAWRQLAGMATTPVDLARRGASYTFAEGWRKVRERRYELTGHRAAIRFQNSGRRFTFRFSAVVQNYEAFDVCAKLSYAGESVRSAIAPGRFLRGRYWDSRQSNNVMVSEPIVVLPGQTELVVQLTRGSGEMLRQPCHVVLHDFSNLSQPALWKRFSRRFIITRADDVRQHLSLARSLADSMLPMANTGHYFIVDFPLHYYFNAAALALLGDRIESLWLAHLAKMIVVLAIMLRLALSAAHSDGWLKRAGNRLLVLLPTALMLMNLSKFLPIGEGAIFHDGTIVMLLAAMVLFTAEKQWALVTVFACLAALTQRPTIFFVGVFLLFGLLLGQDRKPLARCLLSYLAFLAVLALGIVVAGKLTGESSYWRHTLAHEDSRKLVLVREALHIPGVTIPYMLRRTWAFWLLILTGAGFLPLAMLAGCRRLSVWILAATLMYLLPISLGYIHRIHYASTPVVMLCAAGVLAIATWGRKRKILAGPLVIASSLACVACIAPTSRDWDLGFGDRVLYASLSHLAIADGFMARGARFAEAEDHAAAIQDFKRAAMESPRHRGRAYAQIAAIYDQQGRPEMARHWRHKAQALAQR